MLFIIGVGSTDASVNSEWTTSINVQELFVKSCFIISSFHPNWNVFALFLYSWWSRVPTVFIVPVLLLQDPAEYLRFWAVVWEITFRLYYTRRLGGACHVITSRDRLLINKAPLLDVFVSCYWLGSDEKRSCNTGDPEIIINCPIFFFFYKFLIHKLFWKAKVLNSSGLGLFCFFFKWILLFINGALNWIKQMLFFVLSVH